MYCKSLYIERLSQIQNFVDNNSFEEGDVYLLTYPYLEDDEQGADQIHLIGLDGFHVAFRKEQATLNWDWEIVPVNRLAGVLGEALAQTLYELEQTDLERATAAANWDYA